MVSGTGLAAVFRHDSRGHSYTQRCSVWPSRTPFVAIPVLTGASAYAVADTFGWKSSLNSKPGDARGFYALIVAGTAIGVSFNFSGSTP